MRPIPSSIRTLLKNKIMLGANGPTQQVILLDKPVGEGLTNAVPAKRIWLSREEDAIAQRCTIEFDNVNPVDHKDPGYYMPYRTNEFTGHIQNEWHFQLIPSKRISVQLGYGSELVDVFLGSIDDVIFNAEPGGYSVTLDCRDLGSILVDDMMIGDDPDEPYWVAFADMDVSNIVKTALLAKGWTSENVTVDLSGLILDIDFERQTVADLIDWAIDVTGYQFYIDENGKAFFVEATDKNPRSSDETFVCTQGEEISLGHWPIVLDSQEVRSAPSGGGTLFTKDTDYTINFSTGKLVPIVGGGIASSSTIYVSYVYAAWVFRHGEDIFRLPYTLSRRNQYGKIVVEGDGESATWEAPSPAWDTRTTSPNRVMFVSKPEATEISECQEIADKMGLDMLRRYGTVEFAAVAVPWLQVGDCIQVIEYSSTVSEIYRIVSVEFEYSPGNAVMTIRAYHFGYSAI